MFLDTETTGLPDREGYGFFDPSRYSKYDNARIMELSYVLYDDRIVKSVSNLVRVESVKCTEIHNITENLNIKYGKSIEEVLRLLQNDLENVDRLVCHNINFDLNVILAECYRLNFTSIIERLLGIETFCTMRRGRDILGLPTFPTLASLCDMFKIKKIYEHTALGDSLMCMNVYNSLITF